MNNTLKNYKNQLLEIFKKRPVYSGIKDNIWFANLADVQLKDFYYVPLIFLVNMLGLFL